MTGVLGVVIVTYNATEVICDCLSTLLASSQDMRVVVVDNASTDGTAELIETWCIGEAKSTPSKLPFVRHTASFPVSPDRLHLVRSKTNRGFAAGVNQGLSHLLQFPRVDRFWILNPDTLVPPQTPETIAAAPPDFDLMGTRVLYAEPPHRIQIDAGTINWWTGVTANLNLGADPETPPPETALIEFISGASLIATRAFVERAGPMPEHYFLYYEEVDWAQRAKKPFGLYKDAFVYHLAGSAIGSPTLGAVASPVSVYFKHRARMKFLRKFNPSALTVGYAYGIAKSLQHLLSDQKPQARAVWRALHGRPLSADIASNTGHKPVESRT